jgi:hypothetical protein
MSLVAPELDYAITSFAAGFLDTPEPSRLPIGATPSGGNAMFYSPDAGGAAIMGKRPGARLVNPVCVVAGTKIDGMYEFRREGVATGQLLLGCNGSVYLWDGASAFSLLGGGFTAGNPLEASTFRNLALLTDGTLSKMYDGTSYLDVGFVAPTAAPAIAVVAGPGVTGTYQGLAVWYDSTHDHESSPSAATVATAFANQQRQWTKPAGAPPANVDKWRIYVRRTDTNEVYYKFVAETPVGTATVTEQVTDAARNLATTLLAPLPNANDVPPTFAFTCVALGYRFGVARNDSYVWVSALGDPQSQHPKDKIGVSRGDGQQLTTIKRVGTRIIAQKGRATFEMTGDRMPFIPQELNPAFGNHQQASSVDGGGSYWAWDEVRGPYRTDLAGRWDALADGTVSTFVAAVNKTANIRCIHLQDKNLVCWLVATGASTRLRSMLAYNYLLGAWLPPIYGIEYAAGTAFQLSDGSTVFFVGDQWGRVYRYFTDDVEGVPSGTLIARVSAATASTVTVDNELTIQVDGSRTVGGAAAFYATSDGLKGMPVAVVDSTGTYWQWRIVQSNTGTQITIDTTNGTVWDRTPDATFYVVVGGIDWFWTLPLVTFGKPLLKKRGCYVYGEVRATNPKSALQVRGRLNSVQAALTTTDTFPSANVGVWGSGIWGSMLWASGSVHPTKQRLARAFYGIQFELANRYPNQPMQVVTFGFGADPLSKTWVTNAR